MKKSYIFTLAAAAMAFLAGCQKSEITMSEQTADAQTIRVKVADFNPSTKVSAVDITAETVKFQWELNDTIMFVNMASNTDTLRFLCTDAGTGTFKNISSKDLDADSPYRIYYPASGYKAILESGVPHETYRGNQIPREHLIAGLGPSGAGYPGDLTEFTLDSHMPVIHLKLKGTAKIGSIEYYKGETSLSSVLECGDGVQLDAETPTDFYLTVCEADESSFSMSFYDVSGQELTSKTSKMNLTGCFNTIVDMPEITVNATEDPDTLPDGALAGEFSVGEGKTVHFSQGNLQATYNGSSYSWGFAAHQYDYVGNVAGNTTIDSQTTGKVVDLFGWSTDAANNNWGIHTIESYTKGYTDGNFKDWGLAIDDKGTWRTLTTEEWCYLFDSRTVNGGNKEGKSYQRATINSDATSVYGMILYPDGYTSQTAAESYTSAEWTALEKAGCVFLPAAGYRKGSKLDYVGSDGGYWSSTASGDSDAHLMYFYSDGVFPGSDTNPYYCYNVRLITDASAGPAPAVAVTNVTLDKTELSLTVGSNETLTATIAPANATNKSVSWSSNAESVATVDASGKVTAVAAGTATITVTTTDGGKTATCTVTVYDLPDGALPGKFSVSATKKVYFSRGNLYADGGNALHFESNQYSFVSSEEATHVSYFTWSSTVEKAVGKSNDGDFLFCNESNKQSVDGSGKIYYALSKDEWTYLFNNHSKKWVTVNGFNGYAIAPDGFTGTIASTYADDAALAADNLVFLPAAGRSGMLINSDCYYWSSNNAGKQTAYGLSLNSINPKTDYSTFRNERLSVRLVADCK